MKKTQIDINTGSNCLLKTFVWEAELKKIGIIVICHGMAEHIGRYDKVARFFADNGYVVYGYDQRGHGLTSDANGSLGYMSDINNINILVTDLFEVIEYIKKTNLNLPIHLLGHSMGSFISLKYAENYGDELSSLILSGTAYNKGFKVKSGAMLASIISKFKGRSYQSKFIHNLVIGRYNKKFEPNRTEADWLSRDIEVVDEYINDKHCGSIFSVSYYKDLLNSFNSLYSGLNLIPDELPIYLFSGDRDPVGNQGKGVIKLYKELKKVKSNVRIKLYPEGRHEMLNEINKEEVFKDTLAWLTNQ